MGITFQENHLAATTTRELLDLISGLNGDPKIHGILVQLPLPADINRQKIIEAINPVKDVDGLTPENIGLLVSGAPRFVPCTPLGIVTLLKENHIALNRHVVIVGRSNIVGRPLAILLSQKEINATVTLCHTGTEKLGKHTGRADILVVAAGQPGLITADMVKKNAVVVDVGIHRQKNGSWSGDVDFESVKKVAAAITPVPGGVGPMTVMMLLNNAVEAASRQL